MSARIPRRTGEGAPPACSPKDAGAAVLRTSSAAQGRRRVVVLGSTGSIGTSTLDVVEHLEDRLAVFGLSAHSRVDQLYDQVLQHRPRWVTVTDPQAARRFA